MASRTSVLALLASVWLAACSSELEPSRHDAPLVAATPAADACAAVHEVASAQMAEAKARASDGCSTHDDCLLAFASTHCTSECTVGVPVVRVKLAELQLARADVEQNVCPGEECSRLNSVCLLTPEPGTDGSTPGARCVAGRCVVALVCNESQCPIPADGAPCCNDDERCGVRRADRCEALEPQR
jgi:hypothetical protein